MKRVLITGANSYIGTAFEKYMQPYAEKYQVDTVDMLDGGMLVQLALNIERELWK